MKTLAAIIIVILITTMCAYADTINCSYPDGGPFIGFTYKGNVRSLQGSRYYFETTDGQVIIGNLNNCYIILDGDKNAKHIA
jgi:hypothetical protein